MFNVTLPAPAAEEWTGDLIGLEDLTLDLPSEINQNSFHYQSVRMVAMIYHWFDSRYPILEASEGGRTSGRSNNNGRAANR